MITESNHNNNDRRYATRDGRMQTERNGKRFERVSGKWASDGGRGPKRKQIASERSEM